ncbi:MAG: ribosome biogenesis GTPase Der [Flavobacteriales bacterium]|nr:ribosome biogenesis GTPase Der [Flavobacteriales bacterium]
MPNIVAIVGRPNVGKSTLFNRLTETRDAVVDPTSGVTRDRHYGKAEWTGCEFSVIDTGGYTVNSEDVFEEEIKKQVELAIDEATTIVFLNDVTTGITDHDEAIANILRKTDKPILTVANKVDTNDRIVQASEFYSYGLGEVYCISASNGGGSGDLLDALVETFPALTPEKEDDLPRIAVVGKPNVGKSSFINALLGEERNIVTDQAGTTRDAVYTRYNAYGFDFNLVDTAGIRKRSKVQEDIEFYSVLRSVRSIENSDVCILILDATEGIQKQDLNIFNMVEKNGKGVVILVNKWDLIEKSTNTTKEYEDKIRERIAPFTDVPIIFTSALTKQRIHKAIEEALSVFDRLKTRIPTSQLNEVFQPIFDFRQPPTYKGKFIRIKYVMQLPTNKVAFAFYCNLPQYIKEPYRRFLENQFRENFNLEGIPILIFFRKK